MKRLLSAALLLALIGCVAHVTPYGTYIEPLADIFIVGPPVVVAPPPQVVAPPPLPPVVVVPDRYVYYYGNTYYYYWGNSWYWGREKRGPWHPLSRDRWPSRMDRPPRGGRGGGYSPPNRGGLDRR